MSTCFASRMAGTQSRHVSEQLTQGTGYERVVIETKTDEETEGSASFHLGRQGQDEAKDLRRKSELPLVRAPYAACRPSQEVESA